MLGKKRNNWFSHQADGYLRRLSMRLSMGVGWVGRSHDEKQARRRWFYSLDGVSNHYFQVSLFPSKCWVINIAKAAIDNKWFTSNDVLLWSRPSGSAGTLKPTDLVTLFGLITPTPPFWPRFSLFSPFSLTLPSSCPFLWFTSSVYIFKATCFLEVSSPFLTYFDTSSYEILNFLKS